MLQAMRASTVHLYLRPLTCALLSLYAVFVAVAIRYDGQREANEGAGHGLGTSPYAYERTGLLSDIPDAGDGLLNSHRGPHKAVPMQTLS